MSSITHPWVDASLAPIYIHNQPPEVTDAEFRDFVKAWETLTRSQSEPYAVLVDGSAVMKLPASQRRMAAEMDQRLAPWDRALGAGCAFVVCHALARGFLTALLWLSPPVYPYKVVANREDGLKYLREQLAKFVRGKVETTAA